MHVLVVYAHHNPESFTHAVLEHVTRGLDESAHSYTVSDLHAIDFDPVLREEDGTQFLHDSVPDHLIENADLRGLVLRAAGGPIRRFMARRWLGDKEPREIARALHERAPDDVREQQALVARADGLIFVAPVYWMGFPAILKGWFERVFTYGFAYTLTPEGWRGDIQGRVPLLSQQKALILTPTFFTEGEYDKGWRAAMDTVISSWGLQMAGVKEASHVYFYAVVEAGDEQRREYLDEAYRLGRNF